MHFKEDFCLGGTRNGTQPGWARVVEVWILEVGKLRVFSAKDSRLKFVKLGIQKPTKFVWDKPQSPNGRWWPQKKTSLEKPVGFQVTRCVETPWATKETGRLTFHIILVKQHKNPEKMAYFNPRITGFCFSSPTNPLKKRVGFFQPKTEPASLNLLLPPWRISSATWQPQGFGLIDIKIQQVNSWRLGWYDYMIWYIMYNI